jgi:hypothetical protein
MTKREQTGRAVFYSRDSGGEHETTPGEYVRWGQRQATALGVSFGGTPEQIEAMIRDGRSQDGDLFLDYGVKGNQLQRPGLDALFRVALTDPGVTHILIQRRDRLARPDDPLDAMKMETTLREAGLALVFMNNHLPPSQRGKRDLGEAIVALVEYDNAGKQRTELAQKMIYAQLNLARMGFSTGGRPPFGFRRWLVQADGTPVRQLADGERVRMAGHHVVWLPGPEEEVAVIRRILTMLETMPAARVAATLTAEGVPTPDHGRTRTDRGLKHATAGVWRQSVVTGIARNPLVAALVSYGRRSMGDQARFTPEGPRPLEEADRDAAGQPRVVRNPEAALITRPSPAAFEPILDPGRHRKLVALLDERGGTQRGKPRSQDPARNPLGGRVFDMNCTWPMYRVPAGGAFRYTCGLYMQSHGQSCAHNHLDGPTAVRFLLSCVRQRVLAPRILVKLEARLTELARRESAESAAAAELRSKEAALLAVRAQLERVERNLALAESPAQFRAVAAQFDRFQGQVRALEAEVGVLRRQADKGEDAETEVAAALALLRRLTEWAAQAEDYAAVGELFRQVNVKLFARFQAVPAKQRVLNKLVGGVVTFGTSAPPVEPYSGPTARQKLTSPAAPCAAGRGDPSSPAVPKPCGPGQEGESLGNVSRGEPRCTFVNEIIGLPLVLCVFPQVHAFSGDAVLQLVEPGLYRKGLRVHRSTAPTPDDRR